MSEKVESLNSEKQISQKVGDDPLLQDDGHQQKNAHASTLPEHNANPPECELPIKKRKTRRGKSKRKQPYLKYGRKYDKLGKNILKPEAPHNDNQFLLEDHGVVELEERIMQEAIKDVQEAASTSRLKVNRIPGDSDSEDEFYSTPDTEEQYLMKDFDDQYEKIQTEKLQTMSKQELIQEYLSMDQQLTETAKQKEKELQEVILALKKEIDKQKLEMENLQHELDVLKSRLEKRGCGTDDSEDSETDSSDSCSSSSTTSGSTCSSQSISPMPENQMENGANSPIPISLERNGHLPQRQPSGNGI